MFSIWGSPFPYGDPLMETKKIPFGDSQLPNRVCDHTGINIYTSPMYIRGYTAIVWIGFTLEYFLVWTELKLLVMISFMTVTVVMPMDRWHIVTGAYMTVKVETTHWHFGGSKKGTKNCRKFSSTKICNQPINSIVFWLSFYLFPCMCQKTFHRESATLILPSHVTKTSIYPQEVRITYSELTQNFGCAT